MKKSKLFQLLGLTLVISIALTFTACNDDDDPVPVEAFITEFAVTNAGGQGDLPVTPTVALRQEVLLFGGIKGGVEPDSILLLRAADDLPSGIRITELDDAKQRVDCGQVIALANLQPPDDFGAVLFVENGFELVARRTFEFVVDLEQAVEAAAAADQLQ